MYGMYTGYLNKTDGVLFSFVEDRKYDLEKN